MPERQPRKRKEPAPIPESERRTQFSIVTMAAWTSEVSGEHLYDATSGYGRGSTSGMYDLARALPDLADGGYVINLKPLADHPKLTHWVVAAPLPSGRIEGDDIDRLSEGARRSAADMAGPFGLQGAFQDLALLAATKIGEPKDGGAGPFDSVSAQYLAAYWGSKGALIGKRTGNTLTWSDGTQQPIEAQPTTSQAPGKPARRAR